MDISTWRMGFIDGVRAEAIQFDECADYVRGYHCGKRSYEKAEKRERNKIPPLVIFGLTGEDKVVDGNVITVFDSEKLLIAIREEAGRLGCSFKDILRREIDK